SISDDRNRVQARSYLCVQSSRRAEGPPCIHSRRTCLRAAQSPDRVGVKASPPCRCFPLTSLPVTSFFPAVGPSALSIRRTGLASTFPLVCHVTFPIRQLFLHHRFCRRRRGFAPCRGGCGLRRRASRLVADSDPLPVRRAGRRRVDRAAVARRPSDASRASCA